MSEELIKITTRKDGVQCVSARELHEGLGVEQRFNDWISRRIKKYSFVENEDYTCLTQKRVTQRKDGQRGETTEKDYIITTDMAKELCMVENNELGRKFRKYFIACEKKLQSIENSLEVQKGLALLRVAEGTNTEDRINGATKYAELVSQPLKDKIALDKPKVDYYENVLNTKGTMTTTQVAKGFGMTAQTLNTYLFDKRVQFKQGEMWMPYKEYDGKGYTDVRTFLLDDNTTKHYLVWTEKGRRFIYDLLLGDKLI